MGGKVGGQVVIGIAVALRAGHPDFFTTHALAQGVQGMHLIVDAVHPRLAFGIGLQQRFLPLFGHDPIEGHGVLAPVEPLFAPCIRLHQVERFHHRLVLVVVGMELEDGQELRHHAPVMVAIRAPHDRMDFLPIGAARGVVLLDEVSEGVFPDDRVDHFVHLTFGMVE